MLPENRPPTPPGEMLLAEFLKPLGVSQKEFAVHLGWTCAGLNEIVNGKRGVSADSALAFGEALNTGADFWLNLQKNWDLWHSMQTQKQFPYLRITLRASKSKPSLADIYFWIWRNHALLSLPSC